jgi:hypothetical protein
MIILGAINKITKDYIYPKIANKVDKYICPECNKDLIFRHGKINIPHFAHAKDNQKCNYYDKPSETQIHKDAKMLLKKLLENKQNIKFIRKCNNGCCIKKYKIQYLSDTIEILLEYKFNFNNSNKIADVAYIDNNEIKCLFEICHTNKTKENDRPEPWFEINATELIKQINDIDNNKIKINCIRKNINCKKYETPEENYIDISKFKKINYSLPYKIYCSGCGSDNYEPISDGQHLYDLCKICLGTRKIKTIINIPVLYKKYGKEHYWKQNLECTICGRHKYSPYYYKYKFYAICTMCFNQNNTKYNIVLNKQIIKVPVLYKEQGAENVWKQNLVCTICKTNTYTPYNYNNKPYAICLFCVSENKSKNKYNIEFNNNLSKNDLYTFVD